ncbi:MAG: DUF1501 domain-containing protein, partial [Planctomycetes bacterium]|nr:DUF1501 domain-containing protein [Planctomycetota bacterium]
MWGRPPGLPKGKAGQAACPTRRVGMTWRGHLDADGYAMLRGAIAPEAVARALAEWAEITRANAGREHWPRCYSAVLAGGGIKGGVVHGASDRWAAYPARDPVSPDDLGATMLYALGIDPSQEILDPVGRPMRINNGEPLASLFA